MGKYLKQYDKDFMKMAILKQDQTFREQLSELHRVYRVQKLMMREMDSSELKEQQSSAHSPSGLNSWNEKSKSSSLPCYGYHEHGRPRRSLDLERPADEFADDSDEEDTVLEIDEGADVELKLAVGSNWRRKEDDSSDSGASISSSSTEPACENLKPSHWRLVQVPDMNLTCPVESGGGDVFRQPRPNQPSWHFQCLSLNLT